MYVAKTKVLICAIVFSYAKSRFSHETAHLYSTNWRQFGIKNAVPNARCRVLCVFNTFVDCNLYIGLLRLPSITGVITVCCGNLVLFHTSSVFEKVFLQHLTVKDFLPYNRLTE